MLDLGGDNKYEQIDSFKCNFLNTKIINKEI